MADHYRRHVRGFDELDHRRPEGFQRIDAAGRVDRDVDRHPQVVGDRRYVRSAEALLEIVSVRGRTVATSNLAASP